MIWGTKVQRSAMPLVLSFDEMIGPNHLKLGVQYKGSLGISHRKKKPAKRWEKKPEQSHQPAIHEGREEITQHILLD